MPRYSINGTDTGGGGDVTIADITDAGATGAALLATATVAAANAALGYAEGHSYDRPATAAGARFVDTDTGVVYAGRSAAWWVELGSGLGADTAGMDLTVAGALAYATGVDISAYTAGNCTLACLFRCTATPDAVLSVVGLIGDSTGARGVLIGLMLKPGDATKTNIIAVTNGSYVGAVLGEVSTASMSTGLHCLAVAPIAGALWRWSLDGSAVADVAMGVTYVAPNTTDQVGFGSRSDGYRINGAIVAMAAWASQLSNANIVALSTLPGIATYRLPITAATGLPAILCEAARYDPGSPLALVAYGLSHPLTVAAAVTKVAY